jgi:hypothetical protein
MHRFELLQAAAGGERWLSKDLHALKGNSGGHRQIQDLQCIWSAAGSTSNERLIVRSR